MRRMLPLKSYARIYCFLSEHVPEVVKVIQELDPFEAEYLPPDLVAPFSEYPQTAFTGKFDDFDMDFLTVNCWHRGYPIYVFSPDTRFPPSSIVYPDQEEQQTMASNPGLLPGVLPPREDDLQPLPIVDDRRLVNVLYNLLSSGHLSVDNLLHHVTRAKTLVDGDGPSPKTSYEYQPLCHKLAIEMAKELLVPLPPPRAHR